MTFITQLVIKKSLPLIYNNHYQNRYQNQIYMLQENTNTTSYNPIIGSNLGIPLNLFQSIYCITHYNENIITFDLVLMQFAIGIFTYGYDRFYDALQYNSLKDVSFIDKKKRDYYDFLLKNQNFNIIIIYLSYFYLFLLMVDHVETYPIFLLLTSTLFYKNFKQNFGEFKAIYIGLFWTVGTVILPCVLHDHNYDILNDYSIWGSSFLTMFASSNLIDIKDVDEDKQDNIMTIPVVFGEKITICLSHLGLLFAIILFSQNQNYYKNIWLSSVYQLQNLGSFFIMYNMTNNDKINLS
jgi:hypothetical protein